MLVEFASFISPLVQLSKLLLLLLVRISLCFCKATLPLGRVDHWMLGWGAGIFLSDGNFWSFEIGAPADEGASLLSSLVSEAWELEGKLGVQIPEENFVGIFRICFPPSVPLSNSSDVLLHQHTVAFHVHTVCKVSSRLKIICLGF